MVRRLRLNESANDDMEIIEVMNKIKQSNVFNRNFDIYYFVWNDKHLELKAGIMLDRYFHYDKLFLFYNSAESKILKMSFELSEPCDVTNESMRRLANVFDKIDYDSVNSYLDTLKNLCISKGIDYIDFYKEFIRY